jgi:hypothetical protein
MQPDSAWRMIVRHGESVRRRIDLALSADENKDAGREGKNPHYHPGDADRGHERHNANEDEINCQQQHTDVFGKVHGIVLRQAGCFCTQKRATGHSGPIKALQDAVRQNRAGCENRYASVGRHRCHSASR